jgi:hypothetical protein
VDSTGLPTPDLADIRRRRDYHPNTRNTDVCWGPRDWVRDDSSGVVGGRAADYDYSIPRSNS